MDATAVAMGRAVCCRGEYDATKTDSTSMSVGGFRRVEDRSVVGRLVLGKSGFVYILITESTQLVCDAQSPFYMSRLTCTMRTLCFIFIDTNT